MTDLGRRLYIAFWDRNGGYENAPTWENQAEAIKNMWNNIAASAVEILELK